MMSLFFSLLIFGVLPIVYFAGQIAEPFSRVAVLGCAVGFMAACFGVSTHYQLFALEIDFELRLREALNIDNSTS